MEEPIAQDSGLDHGVDVGVDSRGGCMVEERHYVEEEPAFILSRGICGRHARNGRGIG